MGYCQEYTTFKVRCYVVRESSFHLDYVPVPARYNDRKLLTGHPTGAAFSFSRSPRKYTF